MNGSVARPAVQGDEILKTDPSSLARQSITMIYTPKPIAIKSPEPPPPPPPKPQPQPQAPPPPPPQPHPVVQPLINGAQNNATTEKTEPPAPAPDAPPAEPPKPKPFGGFASLMKPKAAPKSEFEQMLTCPKCQKRLLNPKLVCCRRMCQECLQADINEDCHDGQMVCKVCSKTITIPDTSQPKRNWAKQFLTDTFLKNLREAVQQLEGKRLCYVCSESNTVMEASNYCFDCDTYFCGTCTTAHGHMPNQKKHRIRPLADVTATELMKRKRRFCPTHEGVSLDLYCQTCQLVMCQECAASIHQRCKGIDTVTKAATEKKELLKTTDKILKVGISKCEHNTKRVQAEALEVEQLKQQTMEEIDCSFDEVLEALTARKNKLKKDIEDHFATEMPQYRDTQRAYESLTKSMKANTEFLKQLMQHASDFDILTTADHLFHQAETMVAQNKDVIATPKPKVVVKIDEMAVKNFVELVSLLGAEVGSTQVKGILLKKITTKMKDDQHSPDIRDILLVGEAHLMAVDNKNCCVKSIQFSGDNFITKRLQLKSEPWGGTKLQPSMIAVTGLKVIYVITVTDEIALQSTVKTRKDYWGICALSPINLACSCKYPPGVDIVDITGRRLRSIEQDQLGEQLFEMPGYLAMLGDNILVTDRSKKSLTCVDQEGKVIFIYRGQGDEQLRFPRGICVDKHGRIFLADHDKGCVYLLNARGEYLCQVLSAPKPRTMCIDATGCMLYVSMEGKGITFFNLIEVQT